MLCFIMESEKKYLLSKTCRDAGASKQAMNNETMILSYLPNPVLEMLARYEMGYL